MVELRGSGRVMSVCFGFVPCIADGCLPFLSKKKQEASTEIRTGVNACGPLCLVNKFGSSVTF